MTTIKSNREIWGVDFPLGGEWDAGVTVPQLSVEKAGRWTVRHEADRFAVYFHHSQSGEDTFLKDFSPTEQGEVDAKIFALALCSKGLQS